MLEERTVCLLEVGPSDLLGIDFDDPVLQRSDEGF
jgi:hypothetical protein